MNEPKVTIVLPTYNGAKFLAQSLESCLIQTFSDLEVVIVVDGSTDETDRVLAGFDDARVRIIRKSNGGLPRALNTGFAAARGQYWTWTSDDNYFHPVAIEKLVAYLDSHPSCNMVSSDYHIVNEQGKRVGYSRRHNACFMYRAETAKRIGEYRPEMVLVEDADYWHRIRAAGGPIERLHVPLYSYRVHGESLSQRRAAERALRRAAMLLDLHASGTLTDGVEGQLLHCLREAALYRDSASLEAILHLAHEKRWPNTPRLEKVGRLLQTSPAWVAVRIGSALYSRLNAAQDLALRAREGTLGQ